MGANSEHVAVIDLGTNTFHLLVASLTRHSWKPIHRERIYVKLAEEAIDHIGTGAWERALGACELFKSTLAKYNIQRVRAVGTAAMRTADNAPALIDEIRMRYNIQVEVIDGTTEAQFIADGVLDATLAVNTSHSHILIMDIGGGSVEFILIHEAKVKQAVSLPLGVAVLFQRFHNSDPISQDDLNRLFRTLDGELQILRDWTAGQSIHLVGASGTFEVVDAALAGELANSNYTTYTHENFNAIYEEIIGLTFEERLQHPKIPTPRAQYIVVALQLIQYVLHNLPISSCGISSYAMKEGIVRSFLD